ncbi:MAG: hypothetical protein GC201_12135 [Alphaproteobacteria bacterium]|nr:hypothetical protein [Alphaproteobacteria bacterium]
MRKNQVLATVSGLAIAVGMAGGALADTNPNLQIDWLAQTIAIDPGSNADEIANVQINSAVAFTASVLTADIGDPSSGFQDYDGGIVAIDVLSNQVYTSAYPLISTNTADFWIATSTDPDGSAVTVSSLSVNKAASSVLSTVSAAEVLASSEDLGAGSSQNVNSNSITASATANTVNSALTGDINPDILGGERGVAEINRTSGQINASATGLVSSAQYNADMADSSASVDSSRIGSLATVNDKTTTIQGVDLNVVGNSIEAAFTGNDGTNTVDINDALDPNHTSYSTLAGGSLGVASSQTNGPSNNPSTYTAQVKGSVIEAGDSGTATEIGNLTDSAITFSANDIQSMATGNTATNTLHTIGVNIDGEFPGGTREYSAMANSGSPVLAGGQVRAIGDLFVASLQDGEALSLVSDVGTGGDGDLNVLVENVASSTVLAGDGNLSDKVADGNSIGASATFNTVVNTINVEDATTFSGAVSMSSGQAMANGSAAKSTSNGDLTVSVATAGSKVGSIKDSAVTVDGNSLFSQTEGNVGTNTISIAGTDITGGNVKSQTGSGFHPTRSDHFNLAPRTSTDFALVSAQRASDSDASAATVGSVVVKAADVSGLAASTIDTSAISASGNSSSSLAIANRIGENSITVDGTSVDATMGVVNWQLTQGGDGVATDHYALSASVSPTDDVALAGDAVVDVNATVLRTVDSSINADANDISARVYGNLVDANTNSLNVTGVTVSDALAIDNAEAKVDRLANADSLPLTYIDGGFMVLNDQSVEDTSNKILGDVPWAATVTGNFVDVSVGSTDTTASIKNSTVTASDNTITGAITVNQGNSGLTVAATSLDANSTLVNTQSYLNEAGGVSDRSGSLKVSVTGNTQVAIDSGSGASIVDTTAQANGNDVLASGRINSAANAVDITAQTQTVTNVIGAVDKNEVRVGVTLSAGLYRSITTVRSETGLANDQAFDALAPTGIAVSIDNADTLLTLTTNAGTMVDSVGETNGNSLRSQALGNDASNSLALNVGSFDLTGAGTGGALVNGPLGVIGNNQTAVNNAVDSGSFAPTISKSDIITNADAVDAISGSNLSADSNSIRTLARINNGVNTLDVSGSTYDNIVTATPRIRALDVDTVGNPGISAAADDLAFGIGSYQINAYNIATKLDTNTIQVQSSGAATIDGSSLSVSGNALVAEGRANDVANSFGGGFTNDALSGFIVTVQQTEDGGATLGATASTNTVKLTADAGANTLTDSSFNVDGNAVAALISANRASNYAAASVTNATSGSGYTTPSAVVDASLTKGDLTANVDFGIVNAQGSETTAGPADKLTATVSTTTIVSDLDTLVSGTATVDNNLVLAQSVIHSATKSTSDPSMNYGNLLTIDASANVGTVGDIPSAAIISQQVISAGSTSTAALTTTKIGTTINDPSNAASASASVSGNQALAQATGGVATNRLNVNAGADILGGTPAAAPVFGTANKYTLNADYNVLNDQFGTGTIAASATTTTLLATLNDSVSSDSVTVDDNVVQAAATGFSETSILDMTAGASSDVTGQVGNAQTLTNSGVSTSLTGTTIASTIDGDALNSGLTVSGNQASALTTGNTALNALLTSADASLQESSGAGGTVSSATGISVTGADYAVLNWQQNNGGTLSSSVSTTGIGADNLSGAGGVDSSSVEVMNNQVQASTTANNAVNTLVLNTGTFQHPSASVSNLQTASNTSVSASVDTAGVGIGLGGGLISGTSSNSSFTVRGNSIGATAVGNAATNSVLGN